MRKVAIWVCALFVAAALAAPVTTVLAGEKTHDVKGEVVSVNVEGKTLTFKDDTGKSMTVPAMGKAIDELKNLKAGDHVVLTCTDDEKGGHLGVSGIKVDKAPAPAPKG
jgi:Cu/Ag efflux protein CusF